MSRAKIAIDQTKLHSVEPTVPRFRVLAFIQEVAGPRVYRCRNIDRLASAFEGDR